MAIKTFTALAERVYRCFTMINDVVLILSQVFAQFQLFRLNAVHSLTLPPLIAIDAFCCCCIRNDKSFAPIILIKFTLNIVRTVAFDELSRHFSAHKFQIASKHSNS